MIAAIDEGSLDEFGAWPWNRNVIADLVNQLTLGGAKVIAFDIAFTDEARDPRYQNLRHFQKLFEASNLMPGSPDMKSLDAGLESTKSQSELEANIAAVEAELGLAENLQTRLQNTLNTLKQLERGTQKALSSSKESLAQVQQQSGEFYDVLKEEITTVSPDVALAAAIANSPQTILGYICYFEQRFLEGVDEELIPRQLARIKPSAINTVYESTELQVGDNLIISSEPAKDIDMTELWRGGDILAVQAPIDVLAKSTKNLGYLMPHPIPMALFASSGFSTNTITSFILRSH